MKSIIEKMIEYNTLLDKHTKAEEFFNDEDIPNEQKDKKNDDYIKLFKSLEKLHNEITELGYTFKQKDIIYGIGRWSND